MKTIFTLLCSTIFTLSSFAYEGTRITISSISNSRLFVEIDGRRLQMDDQGIFLNDIRAGYHTINIYREVKKKNNIWNFGQGNKKKETLYNNRVYLRNGHHFDILINRFGKVMVDERLIDRKEDWFDEDDEYYENDRERRNNNNRGNRDNRYDNDNGRVMSDHDFNQIKERLQREWFENNRVTIAKQVFDQNYFLSRQVKELLQLFSFENNKLNLAKYAYGRTSDKQVYYIVNDVFSYNKSKEELAWYIREYK